MTTRLQDYATECLTSYQPATRLLGHDIIQALKVVEAARPVRLVSGNLDAALIAFDKR